MEISGILFENLNENTEIYFEGFLEIDGEKINVIVFKNISKNGNEYFKIVQKKEKIDNQTTKKKIIKK